LQGRPQILRWVELCFLRFWLFYWHWRLLFFRCIWPSRWKLVSYLLSCRSVVEIRVIFVVVIASGWSGNSRSSFWHCRFVRVLSWYLCLGWRVILWQIGTPCSFNYFCLFYEGWLHFRFKFYCWLRAFIFSAWFPLIAKDSMFKVAEPNYYNSHIIQTPAQETVLQNILYSHSAHFMYVFDLSFHSRVVLIVLYCFPNACGAILVWKFIEDSITSKNNEIMLLFYLKWLDFRIMYHNIWVSTKWCYLGLRVTKCSCYWKTTWQYSQRPSQIELLVFCHFVFVVWNNLVCCCPVVYLTTCIFNPLRFFVITRLMVLTQAIHFLASFRT